MSFPLISFLSWTINKSRHYESRVFIFPSTTFYLCWNESSWGIYSIFLLKNSWKTYCLFTEPNTIWSSSPLLFDKCTNGIASFVSQVNVEFPHQITVEAHLQNSQSPQITRLSTWLKTDIITVQMKDTSLTISGSVNFGKNL